MKVVIPYEQTDDRQLNQFQVALAKALQPITNNPVASCFFLKNISLTSGVINNIPSKLGRAVEGWFLIRVRAPATVWDTQDTNLTPNETLALSTSADVVVDLAIF